MDDRWSQKITVYAQKMKKITASWTQDTNWTKKDLKK